MSQIDLDPNITIVAQDNARPYPPVVQGVAQNGATVMVVVVPPALYTLNPVASLNMYRGPSAQGPWTLTDSRQLSDISLLNNLFDLDPRFGIMSYYAATTVDTLNVESVLSSAVGISPASPSS